MTTSVLPGSLALILVRRYLQHSVSLSDDHIYACSYWFDCSITVQYRRKVFFWLDMIWLVIILEEFHIEEKSCFKSAFVFFVFVSSELTINKTKIDETGIRFPGTNSKNVYKESDVFSTFFELEKQERRIDKGMHVL